MIYVVNPREFLVRGEGHDVHREHPLCTKPLHSDHVKYIQTLLSIISHNNALQDPLSTFSMT